MVSRRFRLVSLMHVFGSVSESRGGIPEANTGEERRGEPAKEDGVCFSAQMTAPFAIP